MERGRKRGKRTDYLLERNTTYTVKQYIQLFLIALENYVKIPQDISTIVAFFHFDQTSMTTCDT